MEKLIDTRDRDNYRSKDVAFFGSSMKYAGYYLQPRLYYRQYESMDGHLIIMLALGERAVSYTWDVLHNKLMKRKDLYRGKLKQICNIIDNPKGNSYSPSAASLGMVFKGWIPKFRHEVDKNLHTPEKDWSEGYANIMDYLDEAISPDITKLRFAILTELRRRKLKDDELLTDMMISLILLDLFSECIKLIDEKVHGSKYALCSNPADEKCRDNALLIESDLLAPVRKALNDIFVNVDVSEDFSLRDVKPVEDGFVIIAHKLLSIELMAPACAAGGIDIRCEEYKQLVDVDVSPEVASRRAIERGGKYYDQRIEEIDREIAEQKKLADNKASLTESLAGKGWKVTSKAI